MAMLRDNGSHYEPRSQLSNPREFGKKLSPEFVQETPDNTYRVSGAMAQHAFAREVRLALHERGMTIEALSETTGLNYQRLTRILRGTAVMRLDDIGLISRTVPEVFAHGTQALLQLVAANPTRPS
ncbi:hypothetical protein Achl_4188 (plasmid) [Pseudarthrobacter chlorophenolicus A6]|uniref:HTH cro/C1-type domain-containing protein n=1 Tax=Pseudarthrobacter chlorophenolicus (strain ATCC 700700 / DSM 12829 / CIP 107037 / JCM 12360 / KCTC 9906 / NCIMB 13794 / A6) TaxID=452863 RepID=B8HI92_PSECP|nr:helix-turn-helix transcriptional regulator [Pseudarthrobacter chlorophenolicus]ACL42139.1 hypothetical protein Achl_4188 [Pseudarthrobacter chlorophenolicus A6]SDQ13953.1 hypothetical protein SAMN04489738_0247 [Pseudarthrobacter chlorophenolicus]